MRRSAVFIAATLAVLGQGIAARGATLAVPGGYSTIQSAIDAAGSGDVILVSPGHYPQNLDYHNKAVAVRSVGGPTVTFINVSSGTAVNMGASAELTGFTVSGAVADFGAGVALSGSGQLIKGNIFENNRETSGGFGAAIGGNGASPTIVGNVFRNNSADGQFLSGVVSFVNGSSPVIENNVFYNNNARAINLTLPTGNRPEVINNTIVGNTVGIRVDNRVNVTSQVYRNNVIAGNGIGLEDDFGSGSGKPTWRTTCCSITGRSTAGSRITPGCWGTWWGTRGSRGRRTST
jgi:hypothetical protein